MHLKHDRIPADKMPFSSSNAWNELHTLLSDVFIYKISWLRLLPLKLNTTDSKDTTTNKAYDNTTGI